MKCVDIYVTMDVTCLLSYSRKEELHMNEFNFFAVVLLWAIPLSLIMEHSEDKIKDTAITTLIALGVSYAIFGLKNTLFIVIWVICIILIAILIYRIISDLYGR